MSTRDRIRVGHIVLRTPQPEADALFLEQYLQQMVTARTATAVFLSDRWGRPTIGLVQAPTPGVHHLGIRMTGGPEGLAERAQASGGELVAAVACFPDLKPAWRLAVLDPDRRCVEVYGEPNVDGPDEPLQPMQLSHVVLNTADIDRAHRFYVDGLGLAVSDWTEHQMVFLRSGKQHHVLALHQQGYPSVNHIAFEAGPRAALEERVDRIRRAGVAVLWGPGRHGPGNNLFCYVQLPSGFVLELVSELLEISDPNAYQPQIWKRVGERAQQADSGGPPSAQAREALAGVPDPGWL